MFVIIYRLKGQLAMEQRIVGPFLDYGKCEDFFGMLGPAYLYDHKYIEEMVSPDLALGRLALDQGEVIGRMIKEGTM